MSRANALTEVDLIAVKRADEALQALHELEVDFMRRGYVRDADLELLRGAQYNLGAAMSLFRGYLQEMRGDND
jgi:hypothetical protein